MLNSSIHVLIIDDDEINNFIASKIIIKSSPSTKISTCMNGKQGISFLNNCLKNPTNFPDIIFLDINMPEINGWEFLDWYEKNMLPILNKKIIINIISSSVYNNDELKSKSYYFVNKFVSKPLCIETIKNLFSDISPT